MITEPLGRNIFSSCYLPIVIFSPLCLALMIGCDSSSKPGETPAEIHSESNKRLTSIVDPELEHPAPKTSDLSVEEIAQKKKFTLILSEITPVNFPSDAHSFGRLTFRVPPRTIQEFYQEVVSSIDFNDGTRWSRPLKGVRDYDNPIEVDGIILGSGTKYISLRSATLPASAPDDPDISHARYLMEFDLDSGNVLISMNYYD